MYGSPAIPSSLLLRYTLHPYHRIPGSLHSPAIAHRTFTASSLALLTAAPGSSLTAAAITISTYRTFLLHSPYTVLASSTRLPVPVITRASRAPATAVTPIPTLDTNNIPPDVSTLAYVTFCRVSAVRVRHNTATRNARINAAGTRNAALALRGAYACLHYVTWFRRACHHGRLPRCHSTAYDFRTPPVPRLVRAPLPLNILRTLLHHRR